MPMDAAFHLFGYLLNDGGLALEQTGPYPLVLGARRWAITSKPDDERGRRVAATEFFERRLLRAFAPLSA
jgi:hypothetical protein